MKKFVSIMLTLAMIASMASVAFALPAGLDSVTATQPGNMGGAVSKILGAIQWIGYAFAIGMLIYIGIKYTMSAANEKAELKKGLINFIIGAVIIAAASTIVGWVSNFSTQLTGSTNP